MKHSRRVDWVVVIVSILFAASCSGGGCGGCGFEPIPGGFPANKRSANAGQLRVSQSALAKIAADPASVIGPLIGGAMNGVIEFDIPGSCSGNPKICCVNNVPQAACGPLEIDLVQRGGDAARLVLTPVTGASRLDMTIRARIKSKMDLPIDYSGTACNISIDTTRGGAQDLRIDAQIQFSQDATAGTTRIEAQNVNVTQLDNGDVNISGGGLCALANVIKPLLMPVLVGQIETLLADTINDATCKACDSGQVAECGSFATACTNNTCMIGNACMQELGLAGRMRGSSVFGGFSPGTTGALDLYEVAGGYATTQQNGIALGLLGGMQPGGTARDKCGPSGTEPAPVSIPMSTFFQGNTRPDTNAPFDVAIGLHKQQLAEFAWAGYEGGLLCLTIGAATVSQLTTDTLGLVSRSLGNLVETNSAMAIGLRPQSAPQITLGKNTFMTDAMGNATLVEPLLDLQFNAMEIDFYASVDDQWIRVFTVVSDVHLPIGLQTSSMDEIVPVIGDVADAFTNLSVKNSEAITEMPADLAALFPSLLNLVLPQLSGGLGGFQLPSLGGLNLQVTDITAVDNDSFLAIFANLVTAIPARAVDTSVTLVGVSEPATEIVRDPSQWGRHLPPEVTLDFGAVAGLEWSYKLDGGVWSPWSTNRRPTLRPTTFWLPGLHRIEVRARQLGRPETLDPTPELIEIVLGTDAALGNDRIANNGFHGQAGSSGCSCETGGDAGGAVSLAFLVLGLVVPWRRGRRGLRAVVAAVRRGAWHLGRLGAVVWIAALASLPGCSCGSAPCGDAECLPGEVANGGHGRYTSITGDGDRVMVATYDQALGDLVVIDATDPAALRYVVVDGVPDVTPTYDPGTYRGGIEDAGEDVGTWTSIGMSSGLAKVAYHDRENFALKYAYETKRGSWSSYAIDGGDADVGSHASLVIDGDNHPAIAYLAVGVDDGLGHRVTELRLVRSTVVSPTRDTEWTPYVIARAEGTCAGLCGSGSVCTVATPEVCATPTADCTATCGDGTACVAGACVDTVADPIMTTLATGTGLFVNLVALPDGRLAAVYYDRNARALVAAIESAAGANDFVPTTLDVADPGDRGMWASALADASGTLHVAYQDALGDQLMYVTFNGTATTPEVVDDGQRTGDRTHHVGAASAIYLVNGTPTIAYQDGTSADVYVATKAGATWMTTPFVVGPLLDGFSIGATTAHGDVPYLAWGMLDPASSPLGSVVVQNP